MTNYSQPFTVKSNARRAARKAGIDPSKVGAFVKAGETLYRFPLESTDASGRTERAKPKAAAKAPKAAKPAKARKTDPRQNTSARKAHRAATRNAAKSDTAPKADRGLKFVAVAALLRRPGGASITEICAASGWLAHTARARISVDVSKLLAKGEIIQRRREEGVSHYAILKDGEQLDLPGVASEAA